MLGSVRKHQLGGSPGTCGVMLSKGRCVLKSGHDGQHSPRPPRKYDESDDQRAVVRWVRQRPDWIVMRLENAQKRTEAQAARDKALGMEPGATDLVLVYRDLFVVWLEMKSKTGDVSDVQEALHAQLRKRKQIVLVGFGSADAIEQLERIEDEYQPR